MFSFGSRIKTKSIPKYKEEIFIKTLSKLKQTVIWKFEDSDDEGTLIGNVLKVKWLPQYDLLRKFIKMIIKFFINFINVGNICVQATIFYYILSVCAYRSACLYKLHCSLQRDGIPFVIVHSASMIC